jgi:glutamyl-tRNA reductase
MTLLLIGTSHRLAPVEVRERVAVDPDGASALATRLAADGEAVCLSTCNRTEIYLAAPDPVEADRLATGALAELAEIEPADLEPFLYRLEHEAAAVHLFRVAAGLDSLVPGEGEILGQVRVAYERGQVGPLLDRLFSHALHTGKKVRTDTAIAESPGTTSSAAAALAAQVFGNLKGARIAIVGAGKIGKRAARRLTKRGASLSFVANRTETRGRELAAELGGETIPLERLVEAAASADILVSTTSAADLVLTKDELARALPAGLLPVRHRRPRGGRPRDRSWAGGRVREGRGDRRRGGRSVPRLAGDARRRADDCLAPRACGGDQARRAGQGEPTALGAIGARAERGRVADEPDREQAPARADRALEGSGRRRGPSWS